MRVLTLNTHSWMETEPLIKLEALAKEIFERDYELFALQEVNQLAASEKIETDHHFNSGALAGYVVHEDNFAYLLAEKLKAFGADYYWCWMPVHLGYGRYQEGLALFSKSPIEAHGSIVSKGNDFTDYRTRKILLGKTILGEQEVLAVCCHYSWWSDDSTAGFQYEWQKTLDLLAESPLPKLLLGDFNNPAEYRGEGYELITASFSDSYATADATKGEFTVAKEIDGWSGNEQLLRMDYIFSDDNFYAETCEVVFDGGETPVVSDHFGVEAQLRLLESVERGADKDVVKAESLY